jgi:hypothetical protein
LVAICIENTPLLTTGSLKVGAGGFVAMTLKLCVELNVGVLFLVTTTDILLVDGDWAMVARQVNTPLVVLRTASSGAPFRRYTNVNGGMLASVK